MKLRKDAIDLTGKKYGELTVIKHISNEYKRGRRGVLWLCKCDCGKETIAYGGHLRAGKRISCGCRSQSRIFETGMNCLYARYKRQAKKRRKSFTISKSTFRNTVLGNCHYCGVKPGQALKKQKSKVVLFNYNGIDRFDPAEGYTETNCVSCCVNCNHAKLNMTFDEFMNHIRKIYKWYMTNL